MFFLYFYMCALYVCFHYLPFMTRTRSRNITAEKEGGQEKDTYTTTKTPYRKTKDTTRKRSIKYILPANLETIRAILNKGKLNTQKDVNAAITEEELLMVCRLYNVKTARKRDGKPLSKRSLLAKLWGHRLHVLDQKEYRRRKRNRILPTEEVAKIWYQRYRNNQLTNRQAKTTTR